VVAKPQAGSFGQHNDIVKKLLALDVGNAKCHLGLMIDKDDSRVASGNQTAVSV
jgi:hypothetical protein